MQPQVGTEPGASALPTEPSGHPETFVVFLFWIAKKMSQHCLSKQTTLVVLQTEMRVSARPTPAFFT